MRRDTDARAGELAKPSRWRHEDGCAGGERPGAAGGLVQRRSRRAAAVDRRGRVREITGAYTRRGLPDAEVQPAKDRYESGRRSVREAELAVVEARASSKTAPRKNGRGEAGREAESRRASARLPRSRRASVYPNRVGPLLGPARRLNAAMRPRSAR